MQTTKEADNMTDWITTGQAAEILHVTPARVRQLIREHVLHWRRVGARMYMVTRESVYQYDRERGQ
jgi:excisionase family DNA binding protein